MARRRMISLDIIDTDKFLEMPVTSRCLYFEMLARADDDGFIGNPKRLMKMLNFSEDDLTILIMKNYVIPFESGVVVITHWKMQNTIRKEKYKSTIYHLEKSQIVKNTDNSYALINSQTLGQTLGQTQYSTV